ncbi:aminopeptidase Ey-like [Haemaphysalis longicornis]
MPLLGPDLPVRPVHYDLYIEPDLHHRFFQGEVTVVMECTRDATLVAMHSANTVIKRASLSDSDRRDIEVIFSTREDAELIDFRLTYGNLVAGNSYNLTIGFSGVMREDEDDLLLAIDNYPHPANVSMNVTVWTFAKMGSARKLFPCFDEPTQRATFDVRVVRPNSFMAISSADAINCEDVDSVGDRVSCTFERTTAISPDQLALVVTNLTSVTAGRVIVWSPGLDSVADLAGQIFNASEQSLGVDFPYKNLHVVVVATAKTNVVAKGCVIMLEEPNRVCSPALDYLDPRKSSCVESLARHVVFMWFDVLVILREDRDRWLTVTLSAYYAYKVLAILLPTWGLEDLISLRVLSSMASYREPRPIAEALSAEQVPIYLSAAAWKPYAVMRMFERVLTPAIFSRQITNFLKNFTQKTATAKDVLLYLDPSLELAKNLSSWLQEPTYPLVSVQRENSTSLRLQQESFQDSPRSSSLSHHALPMSVTIQRGGKEQLSFVSWLTASSMALEIPATSPTDWILLNGDGIGYFHVLYDPPDALLLIAQLHKNHRAFTPVQRAVILNDVFYAAVSERTSPTYVAQAFRYLLSEDAWLPLMMYFEMAAKIPPHWSDAWNSSKQLDWKRHNEELCLQVSRPSFLIVLRMHVPGDGWHVDVAEQVPRERSSLRAVLRSLSLVPEPL